MKTKNVKTMYILLLILSLSIFVLVGCNKDGSSNMDVEDTNDETNPNDESNFVATHKIEIEVENYGTIYVDLDEKSAPVTVNNFIKLAENGFYNGLTFHRIMKGFMIQGGDPLGTGMGGSDETIKGEFAKNGVENSLSHTRGAISMARSNDFDSASSQFFIVHEDSTFLDGSYAAFGYVTEGIDIVDKICSEIPVQDKNGTVLSKDQPVIKSLKVVK